MDDLSAWDRLLQSPLDEEPEPLERFRREYQPWERTFFVLKLIFLPPLFLGSAAAVVYGAIWISFSPPLQKLWGLLMLVVAVAVMTFAMWIALDKPKQWFAPGHNAEPIPGRRLPRWFRQKRESYRN